MNKEIKLDIILTIAVIAFAVLLVGFLIPTQINEPGYIKSKYLSPAFVPRLFSIFLGAVALILLGQSVARLKKLPGKREARSDEKAIPAANARRGPILAALLWVSCCLFVLAVEFFGILVPSILFLGGLMFYFGQKRWLLILSIMILVPLSLYLFLHHIANVQFPAGILFR
jgi:hypothetical protein